MRRCLLALLVALVPLACSAPQMQMASQDQAAVARGRLSRSEQSRLRQGGLVTRPVAFEERGGKYVGGVSYQVVDAKPEDVLEAIQDPERLSALLPRTRNVKEVATTDVHRRLEVSQGNDFVNARYTIAVEGDPSEGQVRFWLDPTRHHDIHDVWGYFRVEPLDGERSLITVAVALDVGPGLIRMLFENHIQKIILDTPAHMRDVIEQGYPTREALAQSER